MLEVRSAYGYYGANGGVTGEKRPANSSSVRMSYREYKTKFPTHKTVAGSYDKTDKTIEVYFTNEEMKKKTNLGNRYELGEYKFLTDLNRVGVSSIIEVRAKTYENALKNAKAWARKEGFNIIASVS